MFNSSVKNISAEEAYKLINDNKGLLILDVRTKGEYDDGHIPGAKLVPVNVLPMKLDELDGYKVSQYLFIVHQVEEAQEQ